MKFVAFNVYLNGKKIDTLFFSCNFRNDEVKNLLVNRDNYDPNIKVIKQEV